MTTYPNREYKNTLFVAFLTEDTRRLVEAYNAVVGADLPPDTPVEINTLENVLYYGVNNDISFTLDDNLLLRRLNVALNWRDILASYRAEKRRRSGATARLFSAVWRQNSRQDAQHLVGGAIIVMLEGQSTKNSNMPLRMLIYLSRVYEKLLPKRAAYAEKVVKIPRPEFIVLYNGKDEMPDTFELKLSDAFMDAHTKETLELTVTVYNINPGHNEDIRGRSKALRDYSTFVAKVHEYEKGGMSLAEAIGEGVKYAIGNNVMPDFIERNSEVSNMLFAEYDPEMARQVAMEEGYEDGLEKGLKDGLEKGLKDGIEKGLEKGLEKGKADGLAEGKAEIVRCMKSNGWSSEDIAASTGINPEQVEHIYAE